MELCVSELEETQQQEVEHVTAGSGSLSLELVQASLTGLGQTVDGDIVYTRCDVTNCGLRTIDVLNGFRFLQRLCLDGNNLTDLDALADHTGLVHLSARNNKLDERVFDYLLSSASTLERLHLDGNQLTCLNGLSRYAFLMDFSAGSNKIDCIRADDFEGLACLMRVQLAENQISAVDPFAFTGSPNIRRLQLSQNNIPDLSFASYLSSNLDTLSMAGNKVTTIGQSLSGCKALTTLDLSLNSIHSLDELEGLRAVRTLSVFTIAGNPCVQDEYSASLQRRVHGGDDMETDRPLSRSEIVMDDVSKEVSHGGADALDDSDLETAHYKELSVVPPMDDVHDYVALAAPMTHGLVRHVVAAPREVTIPWSVDPNAELRNMAPSRLHRLWLLHLFPQLSVLNGKKVTSDEVAQAVYLFNAQSPDTVPTA